MSPPRPFPPKLRLTRELASTLRTRAPGMLYMLTVSSPSHMNQTGLGRGAPAGVTVVIHTTVSSRRWRATRAPKSLPTSIMGRAYGVAGPAGPGCSLGLEPCQRTEDGVTDGGSDRARAQGHAGPAAGDRDGAALRREPDRREGANRARAVSAALRAGERPGPQAVARPRPARSQPRGRLRRAADDAGRVGRGDRGGRGRRSRPGPRRAARRRRARRGGGGRAAGWPARLQDPRAGRDGVPARARRGGDR